MAGLRGVCIGAGYFSQYHFDAWRRLAGVEMVAVCDADPARAVDAAARLGVGHWFTDVSSMLDEVRPDFIDVITPPGTHRSICRAAGSRGVHVICQKPLATTFEEAAAIVAGAHRDGVRLMVHENFRFQPWHRHIRRMLDEGAIGEALHTITFRCRLGDGWGSDAYRARQPYFRDYPRLFMFETGVHFIDTFRFLAGEISRVTAWHRRLNPVIAGEDCVHAVLQLEGGAIAVLDGNRYNDPPCPAADARYTFGQLQLEGDGGTIRLDYDGSLTWQRLGASPVAVDYPHDRRGFAGDSCYHTQRHFLDRMRDGRPFETSGDDYLRTLAVVEACYRSAQTGASILVENPSP